MSSSGGGGGGLFNFMSRVGRVNIEGDGMGGGGCGNHEFFDKKLN